MKCIYKKGLYDDTWLPKVLKGMWGVFRALLFITLALIVLHSIIVRSLNTGAQSYNLRAAEFNTLPIEERQRIAEWADIGVDVETYLMEKKELQEPLILVAWFGNEPKQLALGCALMLFALFSIAVTTEYDRARNGNFYFCSLPYYRWEAWVLLMCMVVGWPFMLVSCARLLRDRRKRQHA